MAKPNFILPNKPAIKAGSILSYNYTDDLKFAAEPLDFSRNSSATRVNEQGLIEEVGYFGPQLIQNGDFSQEGVELITNGDFATDTDWIKGTGWSIGGGTASYDGLQAYQQLRQGTVNGVIGKNYLVKYDVSNNNGTGGILAKFGGVNLSAYNVNNGSFEFYVEAISTDYIRFTPQLDFNGSIDNVSVKEVGQDWDLGPGWSIGENKAVSDNSGSGSRNLRQNGISTSGKNYKITFEADITSGIVYLIFGGTTAITATGTYTFYKTANGADFQLRNSVSNFIGSISNISVVEIIGDKPRIDYSDSSTEPSLLLEPQSTNLITQSENFSSVDWTKTLVTASANDAASPSGEVNASLIQETVYTSSIPSLRITNNIPISAGKHTLSFYVKNNSGRYLGISFGNNTNRIRTTFDFDTETFKTPLFNGITEGEVSYTTIGDYYRILITANFTSGLAALVYIMPLATDSYPFFEFQNSDNRSFYLWGAQVEASSYATSYIPTSGSTATRLGETANNAGGAGVFNSGEGVLYAELSGLVNGGVDRSISLSDGTTSNYLRITLHANSNRIAFFSGNGVNYNNYDFSQSSDLKMAFQYKENDWKIYINGTLKGTDTSALTFSPNTLSNLSFSLVSTSPFYGKTKNIQVFNYALTDEELQTLTT
jgi:hypothetical protein